jgi:opacity protein-like surface antigen
MKRTLLAAIIFTSSFAYADTGFYTSLKLGVSDTKFENNKNVIYDSNREESKATIKNKDTSENVYPNISAAVGFDFSKISNLDVRTELEYTYKDKTKYAPNVASFSDNRGERVAPENTSSLFVNELSNQSLMINTYYDFKNTSKFTPYLSAGAGISRVKHKTFTNKIEGPDFDEANISFSDTSNNFTWSAGAGVSYKMTEDLALDLAYRYVDVGEIKSKNTFNENIIFKNTADLVSHDYSLGIRYKF